LGGVWEGWNMQVVCTAIHVSWFCFSGANLFGAVVRKWTWLMLIVMSPSFDEKIRLASSLFRVYHADFYSYFSVLIVF